MQQSASRLGTAVDVERLTLLKNNLGLLRTLIGAAAAATLLAWLVVVLLQVAGVATANTVTLISIAAAVALAVYGSAFVLLRRGHAAWGSWVLFYGLVLCCALAAYLLGGADSPVIMIFLIPVIAAGLLGRGRDGVLVMIAALVAYLTIVVAELAGAPMGANPPAWVGSITFLGTVGLVGFLAWRSGRDLGEVAAQSGERASQLMHNTELLMEKNIQQVELGSELAAAAGQLQAASQAQASGATEQASAVSEVGTTIEELGSTARQIAQAADHVSQAAQQTLENLSSGQGAVDESIQAMERIRGRVQDVSTRVLSLGERSQQIGEIIDLIDDISDETHLLALNAAIEAAGAGEHGRRFAVVAAEVKSLANRTLTAAKEVKGVIAEIRQATAVAVLAAEEGSKEVERGVELAHRAGQLMDNIVMVAERTAQAAAEIGLATAQQQSASEQVVETMREIAEVARQSALGARQMAESSATLTAIADRLHGIVIPDE